MTFEWDEAKRLSNLTKHGIDFFDIEVLFDGRPTLTVPSVQSEEARFLSTAPIGHRFYTVVWTRRGPNIRLISARRARPNEERAYRALHLGRA